MDDKVSYYEGILLEITPDDTNPQINFERILNMII